MYIYIHTHSDNGKNANNAGFRRQSVRAWARTPQLSLFKKEAVGVVVSHPLSMREAQDSIPSVAKCLREGHSWFFHVLQVEIPACENEIGPACFPTNVPARILHDDI